MNTQSLIQLLFNTDPASTQCKTYDSFNEYTAEAKDIEKLLISGVPFKYAYFSVLTNWFWVDHISTQDYYMSELEYYSHAV